MQKTLIITTTNDISLPLFFLNLPANLQIEIILYEDELAKFKKLAQDLPSFKLIYARDPFNSIMVQNWEQKIQPIVEAINTQPIQSIDHVTTIKDFYLEDKWEQYQLLSQFMAPTKILEASDTFNPKIQFIKKRISSRAKGIIFDLNQIDNPSRYILQDKLNIQEEYRIFTLFNQVISPAVYKSSKTQTSKVKIDRSKTKIINPELAKFVQQILNQLNLDFTGLDIALTTQNEYRLIEVNRSPQFKAFYETTGINLASELLAKS